MAHETPAIRWLAVCLPLSAPLGRGGGDTLKRWWRIVVNAQLKTETLGGSSPQSCNIRP